MTNCTLCQGKGEYDDGVLVDMVYVTRLKPCPCTLIPPAPVPANTDWEGLPVSPDETEDTEIRVWEIDPHLQSRSADVCWERSWQQMLKYVSESLETYLEGFSPEELEAGVNLRLRVIRMPKREYLEVTDEGV